MTTEPEFSCVFTASTRLAAPPDVVFEFHRDPRNLVTVMPPTFRLERLEIDGPAAEGGRIGLHGREWLVFPIRWTGRWRTVRPPCLLIDEMIEGPFRQFVHEHHFEPDGAGGCRLTDRVTYSWGRGWWGRLFSGLGVRAVFTVMFAWRHHRTRAWARRTVAGRAESARS